MKKCHICNRDETQVGDDDDLIKCGSCSNPTCAKDAMWCTSCNVAQGCSKCNKICPDCGSGELITCEEYRTT